MQPQMRAIPREDAQSAHRPSIGFIQLRLASPLLSTVDMSILVVGVRTYRHEGVSVVVVRRKVVWD
jgi:hypothetical protein